MKYTNEELAVMAKTDKIYADILIRQNMKLVYTIAHQYKLPGVELEDRIQDGLMGMYESIKSYDPAKGMFSTHTSNWIRAYIIRAGNDQANRIRLPTHMVELRVRLLNIATRIAKTEGVMATVERLHKEVNATGARQYSLEDVKHILAINESTIPSSLDTSATNSDGDEVNAHELLGGRTLEADLIRDERMIKLTEAVNHLDPTSRYIASKVIGLNGYTPTAYRSMDHKIFDTNGNTIPFTTANVMFGNIQDYLTEVMAGNIQLRKKRRVSDLRDVVVVMSTVTKKVFVTANIELTMNNQYNYKATLQLLPEVGDILRQDPSCTVVCFKKVSEADLLGALEMAVEQAADIADSMDGEVLCPEYMSALEAA